MGILGDLIDNIMGIFQPPDDIKLGYDAIDAENERAAANLGFQEDKLNWDKEVQQKTWDREDTSVQRRVADLKAAGLSPVLAAGQGARSGDVVRTTAPQSGSMAPQMAMNMVMQMKQMKIQEKAVMAQMMQAGANTARTFAENKLINAQVDKVNAETVHTTGKEVREAGLYDLKKSNIEATVDKIKAEVEVQKTVHDVNLTKTQNQRLLNEMTKVERDWLMQTQLYVEETLRSLPSGHPLKNLNPTLQKFVSIQLDYLIKDEKRNWFNKLGLPFQENIPDYKKLITKLIQEVAKTLGVKQ